MREERIKLGDWCCIEFDKDIPKRQAKQPPLLSKTRWCFLKRRENLTPKQGFKLDELLKMNLRTVKTYLLREQFQKFWEYRSPGWAGKFLDQWCHAATFSRIEPMKDLAKMLTAHRPLILNYFRAKRQFNSGIVEGLNRKINLTIRKSFGFRTLKIAKVCLYHQLGELPNRSSPTNSGEEAKKQTDVRSRDPLPNIDEPRREVRQRICAN